MVLKLAIHELERGGMTRDSMYHSIKNFTRFSAESNGVDLSLFSIMPLSDAIADPRRNDNIRELYDICKYSDTNVIYGRCIDDNSRLYSAGTAIRGIGNYKHPARDVLKTHLYGGEKDIFASHELTDTDRIIENNVVHVKTRDGNTYNIGIGVCYDFFFPEFVNALAQESDLLIFLSAVPKDLVESGFWEKLNSVRTVENHIPIINVTSSYESAGFSRDSYVMVPPQQSGGYNIKDTTIAQSDKDKKTIISELRPEDFRDRRSMSSPSNTRTVDLFRGGEFHYPGDISTLEKGYIYFGEKWVSKFDLKVEKLKLKRVLAPEFERTLGIPHEEIISEFSIKDTAFRDVNQSSKKHLSVDIVNWLVP